MLINLPPSDLDRAVELLAVVADNIFFYLAIPTLDQGQGKPTPFVCTSDARNKR